MTYTGEMVLPRNAVVMDTEEMRYVEGGVKRKKLNPKQCKSLSRWCWGACATSTVISVIAGYLGIVPGLIIGAMAAYGLARLALFFDAASETRHGGAYVWMKKGKFKKKYVRG